MSEKRPGIVRRALAGALRAVDLTRRVVVNLIFLAIVALVAVAWYAGTTKVKILEGTALVINIKGDVVEQYTGSAREAEFAEALGQEARETQLRDLVGAIDAAAKDTRIARIVLLLDDMGGAGLAKLREIAAALERFKATGKQVIAWGTLLEQRQYFLAAHASEAYLHPFGAVVLTGFGGYRNYYHDALERLGVTIHVFRVGKFKSAVEPLIDNGPSKEAAEAEAFYLNDQWAGFTGEIETLRHLPGGAVATMIAEEPVQLPALGGDLARWALETKLVDGLKTRNELRALLLERGKPDAEHKTFRQISLSAYRSEIADTGDSNRQVGIVVAEGLISDGDEPQGSIGGRSTSELVRKAREDSTVKALVLRVDSGGGSPLGSELIRRELELTRASGKPVVVSMSDVAASGGYWISTAGERVYADSATVTGSIGVFGVFPTAERTMDKLGIHTGGTATAWPAQAADLRRPIDSRLASVMQSTVGYIYQQFLERVSQARQMAPEKVDEIAQGRVWTGRQARERGLVDELGGLQAAVQQAASLAKLGEGYRTTYIEAEPKGWSQFLPSVPGVVLRRAAAQLGLTLPLGAGVQAASEQVRKDFAWLAASVPGRGQVLAHCLCGGAP
ncbi:MAG TPA: signal peptide peptidase SppA [Burkholderiaceae bacterium]|nr:signal peptide peptidase SppA [Burkholderiaceae bacterium]